MKNHSSYVREGHLQECIKDKVRCHVCERRCTIVEGGQGWCRTRQNRRGRLVTLVYGAATTISANPIEKKPLYHFYPGTYAMTIGSWSCNFGCPWCQNWDISKESPPVSGDFLSPERFVELTEAVGCEGTSISFNEPTLSLEWSINVFRIARQRGLYNTCVTNGYMTHEAFSLLKEAGLDAMNVDIKGDAAAVRKYCKGIDIEKLWATCRLARSSSLHLEITTLVIPGVNDTPVTLDEIAKRIRADLGQETPWHVTGYHPAYRFNAPRTPLDTLEEAWWIGKRAGLQYIYVGNVPDHRHYHTECPNCGKTLIKRSGYRVVKNVLSNGRCPQCAMVIAGVWEGYHE